MRPHNNIRTFSLFLAFTLLFYALLPFYSLYQLPERVEAGNPASLLGENVILCTAEGFRLVRWEDVANGKEQPAPHARYQCPLCYVAAHGLAGGLPGNTAVADAPLLPVRTVFYADLHTVPIAERAWQRRHTRSPPVSFSI